MSGIVDWLSGIAEKISNLPLLIYNSFKTALDNIGNFIQGIPSAVYNAFKTILGGIKTAIGAVAGAVYDFFKPAIDLFGGFVKDVIDFFAGLGELIVNAIKRVFIPDDGVVESIMDKLKANFNGLLISYDLKGLVSDGRMFADIKVTMYGKTMTIVDASVIEEAVLHFRSIIRGFIVLLLVLFNINQFLGFIGQPAISIVGGLQAWKSTEKGSDKE